MSRRDRTHCNWRPWWFAYIDKQILNMMTRVADGTVNFRESLPVQCWTYSSPSWFSKQFSTWRVYWMIYNGVYHILLKTTCSSRGTFYIINEVTKWTMVSFRLLGLFISKHKQNRFWSIYNSKRFVIRKMGRSWVLLAVKNRHGPSPLNTNGAFIQPLIRNGK